MQNRVVPPLRCTFNAAANTPLHCIFDAAAKNQRLANVTGVDVKAYMLRTEYGNVGISNKEAFFKPGLKKFKESLIPKKVDGKKGELYWLGAPFPVEGTSSSNSVNSDMWKFSKAKPAE